jgi:PhoD-like phosphatase
VLRAKGAGVTASLVLGPLLRYVDETTATIWVETDRPCTVRVLGYSSPTFTVHGHHYALVDVEGLEPGTSVPYEVHLDDAQVWPPADSQFPPSRIRTPDPDGAWRISYGSCRTSVGHRPADNRVHGVDMLRAFALRMAEAPEEDWPDLLLLLGDQVYADETSREMQEFINGRRDTSEAPGKEVADYQEYAHLYKLAWTDPTNRWLLSTLPSMMIFDDHDIRDDWNTSHSWKQKVQGYSWWRDRITGGLASYWVYQHLGNLSPAERAGEELFQQLLRSGADGGERLEEFAWLVDQRPEGYRWSYSRDFGRTRLIMVDSRCSRVLDPARRDILDAEEWDWLSDRMRGDVDHLLVGTSLPFLLPPGLHDFEAWNEAVAQGSWGRLMARGGEAIRQAVDLEHWAAFQRSFARLSELVRQVAVGERGEPPATIVFLSGDVHYSYLAPASFPGQGDGSSRIYQAVCSPVRNPLPRAVRLLNGFASFGVAGAIGGALSRSAGVRHGPLRWRVQNGPWFPNALATLEISGRTARAGWQAAAGGLAPTDEDLRLRRLAEVDLTGPATPARSRRSRRGTAA